MPPRNTSLVSSDTCSLFCCCYVQFMSVCAWIGAGILFCEVMSATDVILIRGARRFNSYTGYLSTFTFAGFYPHATSSLQQHVAGGGFASLAIDSVMGNHFNPKAIIRDLNKAYLGFRASALHCAAPASKQGAVSAASTDSKAAAATAADSKQPATASSDSKAPAAASAAPTAAVHISTGGWGCGAFGGDQHLKFLQQMMAAQAAGVVLEYSTFHNTPLCNSLKALAQAVADSGISIGELTELLCTSGPTRTFEQWISAKLEQYVKSKKK